MSSIDENSMLVYLLDGLTSFYRIIMRKFIFLLSCTYLHILDLLVQFVYKSLNKQFDIWVVIVVSFISNRMQRQKQKTLCKYKKWTWH